MKRAQSKQNVKAKGTNAQGKRKGGRFGLGALGAAVGLGAAAGIATAGIVAAASRPSTVYVQSPTPVYAQAPAPVYAQAPAPADSGDYRVLAVPADVWSSPMYASQVRSFLDNGVIRQEYYMDNAGRQWVTLLIPTWNNYYQSTFSPWYRRWWPNHRWNAFRPWFPRSMHRPRWGKVPRPVPRMGRRGGSASSAPVASGYEATWRERVARLKEVDDSFLL